jgi:hypothetical protein
VTELDSVSQLRVAVAEAGTVWEPEGRGMPAIGSHYQKSGEDTAGWEDLSLCFSEL